MESEQSRLHGLVSSTHTALEKDHAQGDQPRLSILKKTLRDATLRLCQRSQLTLLPLNRPTWLTTRSSNDRWEVAADIQTGEQYSSTRGINAQKHLATTVTSWKTLIVFLKMPTLIEAEAAIALTCFSNVNLESRMTPKIFNSETISTSEPSINKSGNKGSTVREREISILLVLLGFINMPHLLHQSLFTAKSSFNDDISQGCGILWLFGKGKKKCEWQFEDCIYIRKGVCWYLCFPHYLNVYIVCIYTHILCIKVYIHIYMNVGGTFFNNIEIQYFIMHDCINAK